MASSSFRFVRHAPAVAAVMTSSSWSFRQSSNCEAPTTTKPKTKVSGMVPDAAGDFYNLFPRRQLWQPKLEYPLWDKDWDGRSPKLASSGSEEEDRRKLRKLRKEGVTRHIILVRHGQYDETEQDDSKRILTEIGRKQADYTGKRLREMLDGANEAFGPCNIKVIRVSNMARAKETADIIASHLPGVERLLPDADLNEGRPAHNIPGGKASASTIKKTDETHPRIEGTFQKYFYRADPPPDENEEEITDAEEISKHEFEIIVCHANVIRYFFCRYVDQVVLASSGSWLFAIVPNYKLFVSTQSSSAPSRSMATTLYFQLFSDLSHNPPNRHGELSDAGRRWTYSLRVDNLLGASWIQLVRDLIRQFHIQLIFFQ
eukprot:scaffold22574_cov125-Cylindrotheca_fusiformis.AAC.14